MLSELTYNHGDIAPNIIVNALDVAHVKAMEFSTTVPGFNPQKTIFAKPIHTITIIPEWKPNICHHILTQGPSAV